MSFNDLSEANQLKGWLFRLGMFSIPLLFLAGDLLAGRVYIQGNYPLALLIAGGLTIILIIGYVVFVRN
jgi:hypothetical protein